MCRELLYQGIGVVGPGEIGKDVSAQKPEGEDIFHPSIMSYFVLRIFAFWLFSAPVGQIEPNHGGATGICDSDIGWVSWCRVLGVQGVKLGAENTVLLGSRAE